MPTYEYNCKRCGDAIEVFQSFSEKPLRKHPDCGGDLQKVFHARGVVFKGSGFYSTDSRSSASKSSKKTEPAKKADSSKKSETPAAPSTAGTSSSD